MQRPRGRIPDGERARIVNLQFLCAIQYAVGWRTKCGKHTVKVRAATPEISRAVTARKVAFMVSENTNGFQP